MTEQTLVQLKEVWVPAHKPFVFKEQQDPTTGKKSFILEGMILPFGKISRNNVLYNRESVEDHHEELIGRSTMYNHLVEGQHFPVGHFIESWTTDDGWFYRADIDPSEKDLIRKLQRGDLRHVSIQLIGSRVIERQDENGNIFTEAFVSDIIEGSIVPAPGFLDTTATFAEAIAKAKGEDVMTTTARGVIPTLLKGFGDEKKKEGADELFLALKKIYPSVSDELLHTISDSVELMIEKEMSELENLRVEMLADHFISMLGEGEVKKLIVAG